MKKIISFGVAFTIFSLLCYKANADSIIESVIHLNEKDTTSNIICEKLGLTKCLLGLSKIQLMCPSRISEDILFVLGISWEGPKDGILLLQNKNGNVLSKIKTGYIKSIGFFDVDGDNYDEILVDSVNGVGTGYREDIFSVILIDNSRLNVIWSELSYKKSFPGLLARDENYVIKGMVRFDDVDNQNAKRIVYYKEIIEYDIDPSSGIKSVKSIKKTRVTYVNKEGSYMKETEDTEESGG